MWQEELTEGGGSGREVDLPCRCWGGALYRDLVVGIVE
jgi:hypothetical protein